jgi:ATP-dependent Clp protease ATP-binding subunit ClpA
MFERFTKAARRVVLGGVKAATELGSPKVQPQHLLLSMTTADSGVAARVLADYGVTAEALRGAVTDATRRAGLTEDEIAALRSVGIDADEVFRRIEESFGPDALAQSAGAQPRRRPGRLGSPFDAEAKKTLELSLREAIALKHRYIGSEHILLGLLRAELAGPMGTVLTERGVTYADAKRRVLSVLEEAA